MTLKKAFSAASLATLALSSVFVSACDGESSIELEAPILLRADPDRIGATRTPRVFGLVPSDTAELDVRAELYLSLVECQRAQAPAAIAYVDPQSGLFDVLIEVPEEETSALYARTVLSDDASVASACTTQAQALVYTHDPAPPARVEFSIPTAQTIPYDRTREATYELNGLSSTPSARIRIYPNGNCGGQPLAGDVEISQSGEFSLVVSVPDERQYFFSARAVRQDTGVESEECSEPFELVVDRQSPSAPRVQSIDASTSAARPTVRVRTATGGAGPGQDWHTVTLVQLLDNTPANCDTAGFAASEPKTVDPNVFGQISTDLTLSSDHPLGETRYYAARTCDLAGNCSCSENALPYSR